ncbi:TPA: hypothetical protein N0F65_003042 [Lagenidium giganteum]|uniref:C3HC-type domain-containing protein n=1 Tax=Lagenidium giganteum TaxID=4803 RepID=A0AAV2YHV2_9STRA|nr:TPA: hypothetical protein N0F65_003042 [Lagenidium giganteum]
METIDALLDEWNRATAPLDSKADVNAADPALHVLPKECMTKVCRPWCHADFLARVATFSIGTWFAKPASISVFECARHGWRNTEKDFLACACCEKMVCCTIDEKLSSEGVDAVGNAFAKLLIDGHSELCPWRNNPSPASFTMLPVATPKQVLATLEANAQRTVALVQTNPQLAKLLEGVSVSQRSIDRIVTEAQRCSAETNEDVIRRLYQHFPWTAAQQKDVSEKLRLHAMLLVVCGWDLHEQPQSATDKTAKTTHVLRCEHCNRRVGLWNFAPVTYDDSTSSEEEPEEPKESGKRRRTSPPEAAQLDLMSEHRWFCPWVQPRPSRQDLIDTATNIGVDEPNTALWQALQLPGWQQSAQALRLVREALVDKADKNDAPAGQADESSRARMRPEDALNSVRSVLGISDF